MPMIKCVCGEPISGADDDTLFTSLRAHSDAKHADLSISDEQLRGVVAARSRMSEWDGTRETLSNAPEIRPLTPERRDDWLRFFDRDAFMDNPMWADCYCMFYRFSGTNEEWEHRTAKENREDQSQAIRGGEVSGLLAYVDDKPVAWCHAAPRAYLPGLDRSSASSWRRRIVVRALRRGYWTPRAVTFAAKAWRSPRRTRRKSPHPMLAPTTARCPCT